MTTELASRRTYFRRRDGKEFRFVVYAKMNASKLAVCVVEDAATSEFLVVPLDEFDRNYTLDERRKGRI